ncbi:unnamed protein product, partial [Meganyctiphanes norvegica]
ECRPIGGECSGKCEYCIDRSKDCPSDYSESLACWKPVVENGVVVRSDTCKCCKPKPPQKCPEKTCEAYFDKRNVIGECRLEGCIPPETEVGVCRGSHCRCCANVTT